MWHCDFVDLIPLPKNTRRSRDGLRLCIDRGALFLARLPRFRRVVRRSPRSCYGRPAGQPAPDVRRSRQSSEEPPRRRRNRLQSRVEHQTALPRCSRRRSAGGRRGRGGAGREGTRLSCAAVCFRRDRAPFRRGNQAALRRRRTKSRGGGSGRAAGRPESGSPTGRAVSEFFERGARGPLSPGRDRRRREYRLFAPSARDAAPRRRAAASFADCVPPSGGFGGGGGHLYRGVLCGALPAGHARPARRGNRDRHLLGGSAIARRPTAARPGTGGSLTGSGIAQDGGGRTVGSAIARSVRGRTVGSAIACDGGNRALGSGTARDGGCRTAGSGIAQDGGDRTTGSGIAQDGGGRTAGSGIARDGGGRTAGSGIAQDGGGRTAGSGIARAVGGRPVGSGIAQDGGDRTAGSGIARDGGDRTAGSGIARDGGDRTAGSGIARDGGDRTAGSGIARDGGDRTAGSGIAQDGGNRALGSSTARDGGCRTAGSGIARDGRDRALGASIARDGGCRSVCSGPGYATAASDIAYPLSRGLAAAIATRGAPSLSGLRCAGRSRRRVSQRRRHLVGAPVL
jgi:hypothetical protein